MAGIADLYLAYSFLKRLATPFKEWDAFKHGIIDERGEILRKRKTLNRIEERSAFGIFDVMILKLKRILEKFPGGKTRIASYAAALYLIKEEANFDEDISEELLEENLQKYMLISEEAVNSAGGGNIGGLPPEDPPVHKKKQKEIQKKKPVFRRAQNILFSEAFTSPYNWRWISKTDDSMVAIVEDGDIDLLINFDLKDEIEEGSNEWLVQFIRNGSQAVTGDGDAFRVFSTVFEVIESFNRVKNPTDLHLSADKIKSDSRSKVYHKMIKKYASKIGFTLNKIKNTNTDTVFHLVRK